MRSTVVRGWQFLKLLVGLPVGLAVFSPFSPEALAITPRAERVAVRIAERRYARVSIAEARVARAEARAAEIAPAVPVPPPPRPATVRRMARAGVPLGAPAASAAAATPQPARIIAGRQPSPAAPSAAGASPAHPATPATAAVVPPAAPLAATEPGAWTLDADQGVAPATAEVAPDGTRSVLKAGGESPQPQPATPPGPSGPAVTQPPVELLPTPSSR